MERQQGQVAKAATRGGRARRYFGGRLRAERKRRNWTQVEMARRLTEAGWPVNATVLAKIEATSEDNRRSLKVDEALAVAEVFEMSLDSLLGRTTDAESRDELGLILRTLIESARTLSAEVGEVRSTFDEKFADLQVLDFDGREQLEEHVKAAGAALDWAARELSVIALFPGKTIDLGGGGILSAEAFGTPQIEVRLRRPQFGSTGSLSAEAHRVETEEQS